MNLIAFFQNTDWGFWQVIVAVIFGLIATLIAIIAFFKAQKRKLLSYEIITETKLVTIHKEAKERLEILFDGKPVKDVSLLVFKIVNDGNIPIKSLDFEVPLTFVFSENAEILSTEIVETSDASLKPEISHTKNKISFVPTLLNAKDNFQVKSLIREFKNEFEINTRIVGVKSVEKISNRSKFRFYFFTIYSFIFGVIIISLTIDLNIQKPLVFQTTMDFLIVFTILILFIYSLYSGFKAYKNLNS